MDNETRNQPAPAEYEPPKVESVMGAEDIAREVHYAGSVQISDTPG